MGHNAIANDLKNIVEALNVERCLRGKDSLHFDYIDKDTFKIQCYAYRGSTAKLYSVEYFNNGCIELKFNFMIVINKFHRVNNLCDINKDKEWYFDGGVYHTRFRNLEEVKNCLINFNAVI